MSELTFYLLGLWTGVWVGHLFSLRKDAKQCQTIFNTGYVRANIDAANAAGAALAAAGVPKDVLLTCTLEILKQTTPDYASILKTKPAEVSKFS